MKQKKPFLCRLGFHQTYVDGAMLNHVSRCNNCSYVTDPEAAKKVDYERQLWALEDTTNFSQAISNVTQKMLNFPAPIIP